MVEICTLCQTKTAQTPYPLVSPPPPPPMGSNPFQHHASRVCRISHCCTGYCSEPMRMALLQALPSFLSRSALVSTTVQNMEKTGCYARLATLFSRLYSISFSDGDSKTRQTLHHISDQNLQYLYTSPQSSDHAKGRERLYF